jgi:hypothetical protein
MKLTNRVLTFGLSMGLCAASGAAFAHTSQEKVPARRDFSQYDQSGDHRVSLGELEAHAFRTSAVQFARYDRDGDHLLSAHEQALARGDDCGAETYGRSFDHRDRYASQPQVRVRQRAWSGSYYPIYRDDTLTLARWKQQAVYEARRTFIRADINRDGFLTKGELVRVQENDEHQANGHYPRHRA